MTSTLDDKIALVRKLIDNAMDAMEAEYDAMEERLFREWSAPGIGASLVGYEPVENKKLTDEQIHRLACAPLPRIRTVGSVSRWAGSNRHLTPLEDGRIPQALRLDELDGDRS